MNASPAPLWTRSYILGLASTVAGAMVFFLLLTAMAPYAARTFELSTAGSGFAASSFLVGTVTARLLSGKYLDFAGRRNALVASMVIQVVCCLLYLVVPSYWLLVLARLLHGFSFGVGNTALVAAIVGNLPASRRAEGTGYFSASIPLGTALGPLVGAELLQREAFDAMFVVCAVLSVLALLLALPIRMVEHPPSDADRARLWKLGPSDLLDRTTLPIGAVMLLLGLGYSAVLSYSNSYAEVGGFVEAMTWFFVAYAGAVLVARLFVGRVQDYFPDNVVVLPAIVLFAAGLAVMAFFPSGAGILIAAVLIGLGFGAVMPAAQTIAVNRSPISRISQVTSTFFLLLETGTGFGPLVLGLVIPSLGFQGMYGALAVICLLALPLYWLVHGRDGGRRAGP